MIAIMDYGIGNLGSVKNALDYLGFENVITSDKDTILKADKVILPGVGAFSDAINTFRQYGFDKTVDELIKKNVPILGICVGMQMLFEKDYEYGVHDGLGLIKGEVVKFEEEFEGKKYKIPHMGWNQLKVIKDNELLKDVNMKDVYYVHSYYAKGNKDDVIATTTYAGVEFIAAIKRGNLYATQFHPEKSGDIGLKILKNFGEL
ncbi:MAG: imidazole glycerol phosphate synthase subunit HisH [Acholeplasmatales bacterium]|nr:imidazole glycerol phosphate synthase subunit HisH [Acholeplasmatales bacterium]